MEIAIKIIIGLLIARGIYALIKSKRKDKKPEPVAPQPVKPVSSLSTLKIAPWFYADDIVNNADKHDGGDPNSLCIDTLAGLLIAISQNKLPEFIVASHNQRGTGEAVTAKLIRLLGLNIPVYAGLNAYGQGESPASRHIAQRSKEGVITPVFGGPVTDIAQAIRDGAHSHNMTPAYGTLGNTYNYNEDKAAGDYLRKKVVIHEIDEHGYKMHLKPIQGRYADLHGFFSRWKHLPAVDYCLRPWAMNLNAHYNQGRVGYPQKIVISDAMNVARYFGIDHTDLNAIMSAVEHGLQIIDSGSDYSEISPEPEPASRQSRSGHIPLDISKVKWLHGRGVAQWPITSTLSSIRVNAGRTDLKHSMGGVWPKHVLAADKNGNDVIVDSSLWAIVEIKGIWYAATYDYLRPGQRFKMVGFNGIPAHTKTNPIRDFELRKGDKIYLMVSGLARNPRHKTIKERSNLAPVVLS